MIEKVWGLEIGKATTTTRTKKRTIKRKKGLSFPYYDAIEEEMTEVGEFILNSYVLREFVYDMFLVMAANPRTSDDKLPPTFRTLWDKPDEQGRVAAEYYVLALWQMKAPTLFPAEETSFDVFDQVVWYLNGLADDVSISDSSLPLGYRGSSSEERRRLSWGCTIQALVFH